jgi:PAS domain S-box-containing protein
MTLASRRPEPRPRGEPEPLLRAILDGALDAFILVDTGGVIRQWNRQAEQVFGWEESEAIGRTLTETIIPLRYHEEHAQGLARFAATGKGRLLNRRIEITARSRDGREFPIELTIAAVRHGDTQLFGAFVREITERQQVEERLRFQATILQNVPDSIIAIDLEGRVMYWNDGATALFGYTTDEMLGQTLERLYPDAGLDGLAADIKQILEGQVLIKDWNGRRRDGSPVCVDVKTAVMRDTHGQAIGLLGVGKDITERKVTEDRLRFQSTILSNVRDSVIVTDLSGRVQFWNTGAEAVFGYTAEEIVGRSVAILYEDGDSYPVDLQRIQDGEVSSGEWQRRRKDGTTVWIDSKRVVLRDPRGQAIGILGVSKEITERKQADEALRATHERLRDFAGRMRSVREQERTLMARQIHDELGQVLTALGMDVAWLEARLPAQDQPLVEKCRAMAAIIEGTIGRVRTLATELRPAVLDDLGLLAAIEWETQQFARRTGIACTLDLPATLSPLDADRSTDLFRILQEALTNVVRHAAAQHVDVQVRETPAELVLGVSDDGRGIATAEATSPRSLGLLGMRERALLWNGSVDVRARPQGGTSVIVQLPLAGKRSAS